jgi:uncharacterized protein YjiK
MSTNGPPATPQTDDESDARRRSEDAAPGPPTPLVRAPEPVPTPGEPLRADKGKGGTVAKMGKKARKLLKDAYRPLDSWERYRALTDVLDEAIDLVDLADHKARFALVIMAAVNVAIFFVAGQFDLTKAVPGFLRPYLGAYLLIYVLVALYFFLQAIESLRPRKSQPQVPVAETAPEDFPLGVRFYEDILRRDVDDYKRAWREVHIGQLNAELAVQAHALALINQAKYAALRRLYKGLKIMTVMAVSLVALAALSSLVETARGGGKGLRRAAQSLGVAERIVGFGVKEPSGVAYHPDAQHLYVVGDDGTLAELDTDGTRLRVAQVEPQLEDVAVLPGGDLLLVSESKAELILYDAVAQREKKRWQIDAAAVLGAAPQDRNQGFEGLAFRADAGRPGGGIVYLAHQRTPAMVVSLTLDPASAPGRIDGSHVVARWPMPNFEDLTALTWVPSLERLLVVADGVDRLLVLRPDGTLEKELPLPGQQQEGIAFDANGALWVADDKDKSLLRIPDALAALESGTQPSEPPPSEGGLLKPPRLLGR